MSSTVSEDSFEFVDTPRAPSPAPEANNYGVRTTSVHHHLSKILNGYSKY